ncbi:MAG TPA: hypothetical protein VLH61_09230 [Bacteroidales bacterium]|nr:hypothetical protein [Bacteroidales bacterium]
MKAALRYFMVWIMLFALLVATTGFRLVKHSCQSCNIVEISLSDPNPCCSSEPIHETPELITCCSLQKEHLYCTATLVPETCCEIKSMLLQVDELLYPQLQRVGPEFLDLPASDIWSNLLLKLPEGGMAFVHKHPPPVIFSGTEYLFFLQQIKIPAC